MRLAPNYSIIEIYSVFRTNAEVPVTARSLLPGCDSDATAVTDHFSILAVDDRKCSSVPTDGIVLRNRIGPY